MLFLRFSEIFRVLALLFQKSALFGGKKPPEATAHTSPGLLAMFERVGNRPKKSIFESSQSWVQV